jgi:hypothetical protein
VTVDVSKNVPFYSPDSFFFRSPSFVFFWMDMCAQLKVFPNTRLLMCALISAISI